MADSIITINPLTAGSVQKFKDERLNKATAQIWDIYSSVVRIADEKNRELSKILSTVKTEKSYEKDGFKSVAEYAEKTFGIKKQNAYSLASAGDVYNDEKASEALKAFSPSKLAEVATIDRKEVEKAVESGEISKETSQKELRTFAKSVKEKGKLAKVEVVPMYTVKALHGPTSAPWDEISADTPRTLEEWESMILAFLNTYRIAGWECVKLPKAAMIMPNGEEAPKKTINRRVFVSRKDWPVYVEFEEVMKRPEKLASVKTKDEARKLLESLDPSEIKAMLEALQKGE